MFDNDGNFKTQIMNVGAPGRSASRPGRTSTSTARTRTATGDMDNGEIYKMELDGKIVGKFGTAGKLLKEFGTVNAIDCRSENELYVGEITQLARAEAHAAPKVPGCKEIERHHQ